MHSVPGSMHSVPGTMHSVPGTMHSVPGTMHSVPGAMHSVPGTVPESIKMVKLEFLSALTIFLLCVSGSFARNSLFIGNAIFNVPQSIGNYEYPKGIEIPQNITPPAGSIFKFHLYVSGHNWYQCFNNTWTYEETRGLFFNNEEDIDSYPTLAVAAIYKLQNVPLGAVLFGIRSIISKYDTSGITATSIASLPKPDHPEDFSLGLSKLSNNTGKGAYDDVTYYVRPLTRGGGAPNVTCGNQDPIEWLDLINRAFEANNILGTRRLAVASAYLSGLASLWWEDRKNKNPRILYWDNECDQDRSFVHHFLQHFCTPAVMSQWNAGLLTRRQGALELGWRSISRNSEGPDVRARSPSDLLMVVQQFIPSTLQEAIEMAQILVEPPRLPQIVPPSTLRIVTPVPLVIKNPVKQMVSLLQEDVPAMTSNDNDKSNLLCPSPVKSCQRKGKIFFGYVLAQNKINSHINANKIEKEEETKPVDFPVIEGLDNKVKKMTSVKKLRKQDFEEPKNNENRTPSKIAYNQQNYSNNGKEKYKKDIAGRNNLGNSHQNEIGIEKYEHKTFAGYQKLKKCCYENEIETKKDIYHVPVISDTESYINREKILPVQFNKEDRNIKGCNKRLSNKIEVRKKELTEGHKTFEAACNAWVMKVDSFKIQIKASEDKNQKDSINKEDLNKACRLWISRVKNIIVITKKEQKKHVDTLPSNMMDRIPSKNMNLKLYYERY
ncbi:hypothetical protein C2G38_2223896 [Gigaspora rosea]|uniref:Uncharacterized protein n=1 Tax=Gigaspora rosea TaxID=44941 RepID=A0A397U543_9GLOM|nr:hypothetical protein C2G38_2223896 [Gigaspora rosea]